MEGKITKLDLIDFKKCNNIWNMEKQKELADKFYKEIRSKNRETFVFENNGEYYREVSIVFNKDDPDYCILNKRLYLSR